MCRYDHAHYLKVYNSRTNQDHQPAGWDLRIDRRWCAETGGGGGGLPLPPISVVQVQPIQFQLPRGAWTESQSSKDWQVQV